MRLPPSALAPPGYFSRARQTQLLEALHELLATPEGIVLVEQRLAVARSKLRRAAGIDQVMHRGSLP
jgi:hypothetical protein